jgi:hypothetical protein
MSDGESGYITDNTDKPLEVPLFGAFGCLTGTLTPLALNCEARSTMPAEPHQGS